MDAPSANPPKNVESNLQKTIDLHEAIDKIAEQAKPVIDSLAESAHRKLELLAFRAAQIEDQCCLFLDKSRGCIRSSPLKCVGLAVIMGILLAKCLNKRSN
jgi:ElaB/YqjD/DUF883 family membrane-anchored ribosome-binding protein